MPYIITVLALVVLSVGFTLFQSSKSQTEGLAADGTTVSAGEELSTEQTPIDMAIASASPDLDDEEAEVEDDKDDDFERHTFPTPTPVVTQVPTKPTPAPEITPTPTATTYNYKNGTYTTRTNYKTPDRDTYTMDVTVTVVNDVVTATNVIFDQRAQKDSFVKRFDGAYESYVINKDLDNISLSRIAGASLTTKAFNNALIDIKTQANA